MASDLSAGKEGDCTHRGQVLVQPHRHRASTRPLRRVRLPVAPFPCLPRQPPWLHRRNGRCRYRREVVRVGRSGSGIWAEAVHRAKGIAKALLASCQPLMRVLSAGAGRRRTRAREGEKENPRTRRVAVYRALFIRPAAGGDQPEDLPTLHCAHEGVLSLSDNGCDRYGFPSARSGASMLGQRRDLAAFANGALQAAALLWTSGVCSTARPLSRLSNNRFLGSRIPRRTRNAIASRSFALSSQIPVLIWTRKEAIAESRYFSNCRPALGPAG